MKALHYLTAILLLFSCSSLEKSADRVFDRAVVQFTALDARLAPDAMPVTFEKGEVRDGKLNDWTSGFFPGSLWLVYEHTGNPDILEMAKRQTAKLSGITEMDTDHDIGFQVNCSFGNGYRLTGNQSKSELE